QFAVWYALFPAYFADDQKRVDRSALVVFALIGALCMVSFNNMIMLFLGIEILSVSLYVLAGSEKLRLDSNEAALKYFLMGAFATGFLLFGIALTYGATGSFDLQVISQAVAANPSSSNMMLVSGLFMLLVALVFKVSAAPLHFWAPDVYQGSPMPVTAFMSTVVKTAAFAAFFRLFFVAFSPLVGSWTLTLSVISGVTILIGNVAAVAQSNLKRMLAYSSVAHAGYLTMAVVAMNDQASSSLFFYAVAYSLSSLSAFSILLIVSGANGIETTEAFRGLARKSPLL
ncbi:MAG: NADH-quinone oxidoreductase subunit N, partial [Flavobacteriales bacterium]